MEIYFVRHGQTSGNVDKRHQSNDGELTELGRQQAKEVAQVLKEFKPTHILTSNMIRAIETSRYIAEACDLIPETSYNFVELIRPKHLYGRYHRSIPSLWHYLKWYFGISKDGESYAALRERFKAAQAELAIYPNDARLVVVSHSVFINLFVADLFNKKTLWTYKLFRTAKSVVSMANTQIIKVNFDTEARGTKKAWSVETMLETSPDSGSIVRPEKERV